MTILHWLLAGCVATILFLSAVILHQHNALDNHKVFTQTTSVPYYCQTPEALEKFQEEHPTLGVIC